MGRRRLQKDGHLYKENGWWRLRWREDMIGPDGSLKRVRRSATLGACDGPGALTERKAKRRAWDDHLSRVNQNELMPQSLMKVKDFVERRFGPEYVLALKPGGQVHYRVQLAHVVENLGGMSLRDVKHEHVQRLCLGLLQRTYMIGKDRVRKVRDKATGKRVEVVEKRARQIRYSVQSALHLKNAVSAMFEHARAVGLYAGENPARYVRLPEMQRKERHALTVDQMKAVLAAFPSPAREMAYVAVLTSMNIAEICGLQWQCVNLTDSWVIVDAEPMPPMSIAVRRQWSTRKGGGAYHSLKAGTRRRNLPIDAALAKILRKLASRDSFTGPSDPVFISTSPAKKAGSGRKEDTASKPSGKPVDAHNLFNRVLKPIGAKLGMPWLGWHAFRHTHATLIRQEAMSPADQMAMLGHGDIRMTMQYGEQDLDRRRGVVARLSERLDEKPAQAAGTVQ